MPDLGSASKNWSARGRRYVAPHSREQRKAEPQRSGRRAGQGEFSYKSAPSPETITRIFEVSVPNSCPRCGYMGELIFKRHNKAWLSELPAGMRGEITQYQVPVMTCPQCGQTVRGEHADVAANQCGATAHRLGKRLHALVQVLRHELGIPERKGPRLLWLLTGLRLTQGAISQAAQRLSAEGSELTQAVENLKAQLLVVAALT